MAGFNTTREFHSEVNVVCTAFEALLPWIGDESEKVESVLFPLIRKLREDLDIADDVIAPG